MSQRESGARGGANIDLALRQLARGLDALARRVRAIEQTHRSMPADTILEREVNDDGLFVYLRRISTDERWQLVPPLAAGGGVTIEQVNAAIATALSAIDTGVTAGEMNEAILAALGAIHPSGVTLDEVTDAIDEATIGMVTQQTFDVGGGVTGVYVLSHGFADRDYSVSAYSNVAPFDEPIIRVEHTSTLVCTVYINPIPATNAVRVVLSG